MNRNHKLLIYLCATIVNIFYLLNATAQNTILLNGDTLILNGNERFWINEEITIGTNTMPGNYASIYEAPNALQKLVSNHKKKLLSSAYKGYKAVVVKFDREIGHDKKDYSYNILVLEMANGKRYWCDFATAFNNHEIIAKASLKNSSEDKEGSVTAELTRLKKLLDSGAISQSEYDLLKKKVLDSHSADDTNHSKTSATKTTVF